MLYGRELKKSFVGSRNSIFYRMHFCDENYTGRTSITGRITVQVDAKRGARAFWWCVVAGGGVETALSQL